MDWRRAAALTPVVAVPMQAADALMPLVVSLTRPVDALTRLVAALILAVMLLPADAPMPVAVFQAVAGQPSVAEAP